MKKFLLGTTATALCLALSSPVLAEANEKFGTNRADTTPALTFSGEGTFTTYAFKQKFREGANTGYTPFANQNPASDANVRHTGKGNGTSMGFDDSRFNIQVDGKAHGYGEIDYGLLIGISADKSNTQSIDEARVHLRGEWGTVTAGNTRGIEYTMAVGPLQDVIGGSGGSDGNYTHVVNRTSGAVITVQPLGRTKESTKFNYYTPRVYGFQAGFSFTPNSRHFGEQRWFTLNNTTDGSSLAIPFDKNHLSTGVNYKHKFTNGVDFAASAIGLWAGNTTANQSRGSSTNVLSQVGPRQKTKAYLLGFVVGYSHVEFGAEFIDNLRSQEIMGLADNDAGKIYNFGIAYNIGPDKFSAGFTHTVRKLGRFVTTAGTTENLGKAKSNVYTLTWDRKLAPGLSVFAEGNYFKYDTNKNMLADRFTPVRDWWVQSSAGNSGSERYFVDNNRGHVGMVGLKVKF